MTVDTRIGGISDQFPVGMRVLAVDDNPTCLMVLETLLRKCQYQVTTTSQAITALELMRENKNNFDLVISDVDMPEMDGFKLLEYVGIEMDLPVIMLSSYDDKELVMKGITHGACDYLLKPVRIEELKNIWQHVFRRKVLNAIDQKISDDAHGEVREDFKGTENIDKDGKQDKKRKSLDNEGDGEFEGKERHYVDSSTQKKPRIVWTPHLHRKFVAAVNQLGLDKAVPKKILDLMNDERLTRENVASHLQKYRLYLKKYRDAPFDNLDLAYGRIFRGTNGLQNAGFSPHCLNVGHKSIPPNILSRRLNSPAGLGLSGLSSSGVIQWGPTDNNIMKAIGHEPEIHPSTGIGSQNLNVLNGMPMLLDFDNEENSTNFDSFSQSAHRVISNRVALNGNGGSYAFGNNNNLMLEDRHLIAPQLEGFGNPIASDFSSKVPNFGRINENWPTALQPHNFSYEQSPSSDLRDSIPTLAPQIPMNSGNNVIFQESSHQPNHTLAGNDSLVVPQVDNLFDQSSGFHMSDEGSNLLKERDPNDSSDPSDLFDI